LGGFTGPGGVVCGEQAVLRQIRIGVGIGIGGIGGGKKQAGSKVAVLNAGQFF
jgi:hypothetical protein